MLDLINRFANAWVALPVVRACMRHGVLQQLQDPATDADDLAREIGANSGPLRVAQRLLRELDNDIRIAELENDAALVPLLVKWHTEGTGAATAEERELATKAGWAEIVDGVWQLTQPGVYMVQSGAHLASVLSYGPLFGRIEDVLFGRYADVFARDHSGNERHIDRSQNVVASGAQHRTYFAELEDVVVAYLPLRSAIDRCVFRCRRT